MESKKNEKEKGTISVKTEKKMTNVHHHSNKRQFCLLMLTLWRCQVCLSAAKKKSEKKKGRKIKKKEKTSEEWSVIGLEHLFL